MFAFQPKTKPRNSKQYDIGSTEKTFHRRVLEIPRVHEYGKREMVREMEKGYLLLNFIVVSSKHGWLRAGHSAL